jgi:hypothetical protein
LLTFASHLLEYFSLNKYQSETVDLLNYAPTVNWQKLV